MADELFGFRWSVPEPGFAWAQSRVFVGEDHPLNDEKQWVLIPAAKPGTRHRIRYYNPLVTHPALFKTFADLDLNDRDGILAFANEYGSLLGMRTGLGVADPKNTE